MDPLITSALVTGGANLLGNFFGARKQANNVNKTNRMRMALAD